MSRYLFVLALLALPSWAQAQEKPPIELFGSKQVETWLNKRADELGMARIEDDVELFYLADPRINYLVPIPDSICVDPRLENKWRYVMPQVAKFLVELQEKFSEEFGEACFMVNSAVRTIPRQMEITIGSGTKKNGNNKPNLNAAAVWGERRSLHLTGATIDIGKLDPMWLKKDKLVQLKPEIIKWFREKLLNYEDGVNFDVTEEFGQAVFHVTVLPPQSVAVN
ncbi:MAG: DUF5715 family protein [Minisyncoccia bacterium]